jgi:hypothetical protein
MGFVSGAAGQAVAALAVGQRRSGQHVTVVTSPWRAAVILSIESDATGLPCTKRIRRCTPSFPRASNVAVPSLPRRTTPASHDFTSGW